MFHWNLPYQEMIHYSHLELCESVSSSPKSVPVSRRQDSKGTRVLAYKEDLPSVSELFVTSNLPSCVDLMSV